MIFGLLAYVVFAGVVALVSGLFFRFILNPLAIPRSASVEFKRERSLAYVIFFALAMSIYGAVVLGVVYLVGFVRHLRLQTRNSGAQHADYSRIIPRFTLSELILMVFSTGVAPLIFQALTWEDDKDMSIIILVVSLALFPACFICALYRLDFHNVPRGAARSAALALTPYAALATASIPLYVVFFLVARFVNIPPQFYISIFLVISTLVATRLCYGRAAELAQAAEDRLAAEPPAAEIPSSQP